MYKQGGRAENQRCPQYLMRLTTIQEAAAKAAGQGSRLRPSHQPGWLALQQRRQQVCPPRPSRLGCLPLQIP